MHGKKRMMDFCVIENKSIHANYSQLVLEPAKGERLPFARPGQFVQIAVPDSPQTFLRRPISINDTDRDANRLSLLIRKAGAGTKKLCSLQAGQTVNLLLPLGNGFTVPDNADERLLLVGGGVGIAPLLHLGKAMREKGLSPEYLVGARSKADLLQLDELSEVGTVHVATDDGSAGQHCLVADHDVLYQGHWDRIYCCGPAPMMKAVAKVARRIGADCEVSLENMMACGLGACLCCVENTVKGNVCVCTEGPVFNINELTWQI